MAATVLAFQRDDQAGGFERWCAEQAGHIVDELASATVEGAHGPVPIGWPTRQVCLSQEGAYLSAR
ncbi:hypothetical protein [Actinoplanes sp. NPDC048796]|uniref:hypothetical protein n=1 Tax=Actinoplanes sp. NPDC048796 TaxID=3155640 RepID=UPI00340EDC07